MLHAVPAKVRSAVKLLSERWTLVALYPGQLSARLSGTEFPQWRKLVHKRRQAWKNVKDAGMTTGDGRVPLSQLDNHDCPI